MHQSMMMELTGLTPIQFDDLRCHIKTFLPRTHTRYCEWYRDICALIDGFSARGDIFLSSYQYGEIIDLLVGEGTTSCPSI
jgi:hypothetical protein